MENSNGITSEQVALAKRLERLLKARHETIYSICKKINYSTRSQMSRMIDCKVAMNLSTYSKLNELVESYEKRRITKCT